MVRPRQARPLPARGAPVGKWLRSRRHRKAARRRFSQVSRQDGGAPCGRAGAQPSQCERCRGANDGTPGVAATGETPVVPAGGALGERAMSAARECVSHAFSMTSQWPVLSEPMRLITPCCESILISRLIVRRDAPVIPTNAS